MACQVSNYLGASQTYILPQVTLDDSRSARVSLKRLRGVADVEKELCEIEYMVRRNGRPRHGEVEGREGR